MRNGEDAELVWSPGPDPEACIGVILNGFNVAHGAPLKDVIWCEGEDTGSLTVPQTLVEKFPTGETPEVTEGFDWPHSEFSRYTRSRVETEGATAELIVRTTAFFRLNHLE